MSAERDQARIQRGRQGLWAYNIRILLGNSYWLIVTPVAGAQLVLFWNMAVVSASSAPTAVRTVELLAPILAAFLCAHALAPEHGKVGELVFVRPVSVERVLLLRMAAVFAFVLIVISPVLILDMFRVQDFPLGAAVAAALPGMALMSVIALAAANALRQPLLGFAAVAAFWALDVATGGYFNALVSLRGYGNWLAQEPMSELWLTNKLVLCGLAVVIYLGLRKTLGKPAAPRRLRTAVVRAAVAVVVLVLYAGTGAGYKLAYGLRHEQELGIQSRLWYQVQFGRYGPAPVARLFGPAFPLYLQPDLSRETISLNSANTTLVTPVDVSRMRLLLRRYPRSIWADNAQLEIALYAMRGRPREEQLLIGRQAGQRQTAQRLVDQDLESARREFETLVDRYPRSPFGPLALSKMSAIGLAKLDFALAVGSLQRLIRDFGGSPQAYEAGLDLNAYYLCVGETDRALEAADAAAAAAPWDVQGKALLAAGRAAEAGGKADVARDRYQKAKESARRAADRSIAGARSPSRLNKAEMFDQVNAVISSCEQGLGRIGRGKPSPRKAVASGPAALVSGRLTVNGAGAGGARVAFGTPDTSGFPSPFAGGPAADAPVEEDGRFTLEMRPGSYPAVAALVRVLGNEAGWNKTMAAQLPVKAEQRQEDIGEIRVELSRPVQPQPQAGGRGSGRRVGSSASGGRRGGSRATRAEPGSGTPGRVGLERPSGRAGLR